MSRLSRPLLLPLALVALGGSVAASAVAQDPAPTPAPTPVATPTPTPTPAPTVDPNPCRRPELRLRCPDLVMRTPYGFHLLRTKKGRSLLATTNAIVNVGDGPLEVRGRRITRTRMSARQVLRGRTAATTRVQPPNGSIRFFDTRTRGTYWKFEDAAGFELWALDAQGFRTRLVRTGPKIFYCYRDLTRVRSLATRRPYRGSPRTRQYGACSQKGPISRVTLGTSVGWADIYPWRYPQNWIDVTGFSGCFAYVHKADPSNRFVELDERNNASAVSVRLPWRGSGGRRGCPTVRAGAPPRTATDPVPTEGDVQPPENPYGGGYSAVGRGT